MVKTVIGISELEQIKETPSSKEIKRGYTSDGVPKSLQAVVWLSGVNNLTFYVHLLDRTEAGTKVYTFSILEDAVEMFNEL